jgi:hypothetical protein
MFKILLACGLTMVELALAASFGARPALAQQQTRVYDANGRSIGTAAPQGQGSVRYYDRRGNSLGTSTTTNGTTTFYGSSGSVTGRTVGPAPSSGGRR